MSRRRRVLLVVALLAVTVLVTSSTGFSATAADRDVSIEVAEDPNAYLGFEQTQYSTENVTANVNVTENSSGNETAYVDVTVTNQFPARTALTTVEVTVNGTSADLAPLASGERATHTFSSVSCGEPIRIDASGDGVAVRLERRVTCS